MRETPERVESHSTYVIKLVSRCDFCMALCSFLLPNQGQAKLALANPVAKALGSSYSVLFTSVTSQHKRMPLFRSAFCCMQFVMRSVVIVSSKHVSVI